LNSKAYRFFDLDNKTIIESIDAIFHGKKIPFKIKNNRDKSFQENIKPTSRRFKNEKFGACLLDNGFKTNESDNCIYYKSFNNIYVIIYLYIDDLLIFGSNKDIIDSTKLLLQNNFDMKNLSEANMIIEMRITRTSHGIFIDQSHYIEIFLKKNIIL